MMNNLAHQIKARASELGFSACGIAEAKALPEDSKRLEKWLGSNHHGEMHYMSNHFEKRTDPTRLLAGARSVIVVMQNYKPSQKIPQKDNLHISSYAYGKDYHKVIKKKLLNLIDFIKTINPEVNARAFVDSAPVLERAWAVKAGLGWIGKNTCLISKEKGSWFFLGEIITDMELPTDQNEVPNHCGGCTQCIKACPTGALSIDGLNARRCISYLTIEYRNNALPKEFKGKLEDWIFGCDICQEVCPWNRLSDPHNEPRFEPSPALMKMRKEHWQQLTEEQFENMFQGTAVKRTKFEGLKRNIKFVSDNN